MKQITLLTLLLILISWGNANALYRNSSTDIGIFHGEIAGNASLNGTNFDLQKNGSFEDDTTIDYQGCFTTGNLSKLRLKWFEVSNQGVLSVPVTVANIAHAAGNQLTIKYTSADILIDRPLLNWAKGGINFLYGVRQLRIDSEATSNAGTGKERFSSPLPQLGLHFTYNPLEKFQCYGKIQGITEIGNTKGGSNTGFELGIVYLPTLDLEKNTIFENWQFRLGWKQERISLFDKTTVTNDNINLKWSGIRFGVEAFF